MNEFFQIRPPGMRKLIKSFQCWLLLRTSWSVDKCSSNYSSHRSLSISWFKSPSAAEPNEASQATSPKLSFTKTLKVICITYCVGGVHNVGKSFYFFIQFDCLDSGIRNNSRREVCKRLFLMPKYLYSQKE